MALLDRSVKIKDIVIKNITMDIRVNYRKDTVSGEVDITKIYSNHTSFDEEKLSSETWQKIISGVNLD